MIDLNIYNIFLYETEGILNIATISILPQQEAYRNVNHGYHMNVLNTHVNQIKIEHLRYSCKIMFQYHIFSEKLQVFALRKS